MRETTAVRTMKDITPGRRRRGSRLGAAAFAASLAVAGGALAAPSSQAAPTASSGVTACNTNWGSLAKSKANTSSSQVRRVRAGQHTCFDRMVIDLRGTVRGYDVRYAPVYTEGQGKRVWLKGGADLRVIVRSPAYNSRGQATYTPRSRTNAVDVTGFRTFRQIAYGGSFEGQTTFGVGTRARLPMRVFVLKRDGGSRLVIDVAHRW